MASIPKKIKIKIFKFIIKEPEIIDIGSNAKIMLGIELCILAIIKLYLFIILIIKNYQI